MSKHFVMKLFKEFVEEAKETTEEYSLSFDNQFRWRFGSILDDLKNLADVAIKEYEDVLDGKYEKD